MDIITIPSPNYTKGRAGYKPVAIVIHIMEGTLNGTASWFQNPASKVSAHYGVGKKGQIHRYVDEKDTAWHAGRVAKPTWSLIKSKGPGEYINPNFYTIGIEHEGYENTIWTDEMYAAASELIRDIARRWNIPFDRNHIIGHHEIYAHKTCPGHTVDINKLIAMAAGEELFESSCTKVYEAGKTTTVAALNIRRSPSRGQSPVSTVGVNVQLAYDGYTNEGENVNGNPKWYFTEEGNWFWSGGVK